MDDFSDVPFGRYRTDGDYSGEVFRDDVLVPALAEFEVVEVVLDGPEGYGSSFLDEAFCGLIRNGIITKHDFGARLILIADELESEIYKSQIEKYIQSAKKK